MKKLINDPDAVVSRPSSVSRLRTRSSPSTTRTRSSYRGDAPRPGKVGLVSGGGSGTSLCTAASSGSACSMRRVRARCSPRRCPTRCWPPRRRGRRRGRAALVKNYTGDVMNFEMAAEMAAADGGEVQSVVTDDDVAVQDSAWTAGRRARRDRAAREDRGRGGRGGPHLDRGRRRGAQGERQRPQHGSRPDLVHGSRGRSPDFELGEDEIELGVGIHGEPGEHAYRSHRRREIAAMLVEPILGDLPFASGDGVIAFVNGLGGTPLIELYVMYHEVKQDPRGARLGWPGSWSAPTSPRWRWPGRRSPCSRPTTSCSLWDAPVSTPALRWGGEWRRSLDAPLSEAGCGVRSARRGEPRALTELDAAIGDADHGPTWTAA